jgi:hypothetical protein
MSYVSNAAFFDRLASEFLKNRIRPSDTDEEFVIIDTEGRLLLALVGKAGFLDGVRLSHDPGMWRDGRLAVVIQRPG